MSNEVGVLGAGKLLALDLGRRTGWAVFIPSGEGPEKHRSSGVFELYREGAGGAPIDDGKRFLALSKFLALLDQVCGGFDVVAFEQVSGGTKGRQTTLWNGYRAMVMHWCAVTSKKVLPLPVSAIKKHFCGRGGASKEEVEAAAVQLGYLPYDDNEADAIATLYTTLSLAEDRAELERQIAIAKKLELGEFKSELVVERTKKPRTINATKRLTPVSLTPSVLHETYNSSGSPCSSDSPESAQQEKRQRRKSSSMSSASPKPSSRSRSKKASAQPTA